MDVMALTRRNAIVGLGALAAGAGVIGGTGAFTTVEAERTVELEAAGDAAAAVALAVPNDDLDDGSDDLIAMAVDDLNIEARTTFDHALFVGNNSDNTIEIELFGDDGDAPVDLLDGGVVHFEATDETGDLEDSDIADFSTEDNVSYSEENGGIEIESGNGVLFNLEIDLIGQSGDDISAANDALDEYLDSDTLTIEANQA